MATEKWTPERRRRLTRDALVDAAAEVFARRGFEGASLDEIAETAGYTRGAIYKHFADKEDLFLAVNERVSERWLGEFADLLGEHPEPFETVDVHAVAEKWIELQRSDPNLLVLFLEFNLYGLRNPAVRDRMLAARRENARRIAKFTEEQAAAAGVELPLPADDFANIFGITSDGFSMASLADPDVVRLYEPFLELMIRGVAAKLADAPEED